MKTITQKQLDFLLFRDLKIDKPYLFPYDRFYLYSDGNRNDGVRIPSGNKGKALTIKKFLKNGLVEIMVFDNSSRTHTYYMEKHAIMPRSTSAICLMAIFYVPFCFFRNILGKLERK